jgi:hypothetical protein
LLEKDALQLETRNRKPPDNDAAFYDLDKVASFTECTGLAPSGIMSDEEAQSYADLYAIHPPRTPKGDSPNMADTAKNRRPI